MEAEDGELLERWAGGDKAAGAQLFERHFESVYRFFRNKAGDHIDDLVQSTFLGCVEGLARFRREATFRTYLFQTARYQLYDYYRKQKREREIDFTHTSVAAMGTSPTGLVAQREHDRALLAGLRRLPVDLQIALELSYWEDLTEFEIASVLEIPRGTVAGRLRRARKSLVSLLQEEAQGLLEDADGSLDGWARGLRDLITDA